LGFPMTVTIQLPSDIEADLVAQARDRGLELSNTWSGFSVGRFSAGGFALSPAERAAAWRESTRGLPHTPPLSDDAISRDSIYGDCGDEHPRRYQYSAAAYSARSSKPYVSGRECRKNCSPPVSRCISSCRISPSSGTWQRRPAPNNGLGFSVPLVLVRSRRSSDFSRSCRTHPRLTGNGGAWLSSTAFWEARSTTQSWWRR